MKYEDEFVELGKKKEIIKKLTKEINDAENMIRPTFMADVIDFFISKGYKLESKSRYNNNYKFADVRQISEATTFDERYTPEFMVSGSNGLVIKFTWKLKKNYNESKVYWYPEKQTLEDFYNRRLKKTILLPIAVERKNKLNKLLEKE